MNLDIDFVTDGEVAVVAMRDLVELTREHNPLVYRRQYKSAREIIETVQALGFRGKITARKINGEPYAIIEGNPAERLIKPGQLPLKDPALVKLKLDQYAISPTRRRAGRHGHRGRRRQKPPSARRSAPGLLGPAPGGAMLDIFSCKYEMAALMARLLKSPAVR